MNTSIKYIAAFAGLLFSGIALADRDDAKRLAETKISLTEAVAAAEKHQGGQAYDASLDDDGKSLSYEVEVLVGDKTYEVTVDAVSGAVANVKEDRD
jgi:uncharacterized membrane protein YkoI